MKSRITIVGLGTGNRDELTLGAVEALKQAEQVILRTGKHGAALYLQGQGIAYSTLDDIYEASETFDELYPEMIKRITAAAGQGDVVVGVPGHPMVGERLTYELLDELEKSAYHIEILPGISQTASFTAALAKGGVEGLKILSAAELPASQMDPGLPSVIVGLDNEVLVSDMKIRLLEVYPADLIVTVSSLDKDGLPQLEDIPLYTLDHSRSFDHTSCLPV
jgi:tetrapyrrole methylase family protein/MazG family protein